MKEKRREGFPQIIMVPRSQHLLLVVVASFLVTVVTAGDENRIIGGSEVDITNFPWQASLQVNNFHFCGGAVISERWVLSATHCTIFFRQSELRIRVGSNSWKEGGKVYQLEQVVNHEFFKLNRPYFDISALKTATPLEFGVVAPVKLPQPGATPPPVGTEVRVSGWGLTEKPKLPILLRAMDVRIRDVATCQKELPIFPMKPSQLCAGAPSKSACFLDSGSPMVQGEVLVGIVSYGRTPCGTASDVYTDVAAYRGWIQNRTGV